MADTKPVRVLIVDNHPAIVGALRDYLSMMQGFEVVAVAQTVEEARLTAKSSKPDLAIMDIYIEDGKENGIDLTEEFSRCYSDLVILIYSASKKMEHLWEAMDAGAGGYLLKGTDLSVMEQAVGTVMAGRNFIDPNLPEGVEPPPYMRLTESEKSVLRLFAQWMTNEEISQKLGIALATVKTHRHNIYWKLGINNVAQLYREAIKRYGNPDSPIC
ncbi:two component transcriptional regulator, LuxR family [Nitrosospira sp. Nsp18]|uniref:response regulator n=1 Tax=Nitrosospira sp. Nsp18 TaxID=1855334 RepID=UPI00088467F1|nr:response regulator transcription factor [Nitrosospira sp. Nsp18]SDA19607.1 two component transcriptional regulator, LuxR family [Nitrosospira sp. Nsp18]